MGYILQSGSPVFPAQVSYQLITLNSNIVVTWPFSFASGTIIATINNVAPTANGFTITLPDATLASTGQCIYFNNVSGYSFTVLANDGTTVLQTITTGQFYFFYLDDNTTSPASNGLWSITSFGGGTTNITALTAFSSDGSITIANGVVSPPTGNINFQLPASITNLNTASGTGFPVITASGPKTWSTRSIVAGTNMEVDNGNGVSGNPVINLVATLTALTSINVGNITLSGSAISSTTANTGLTISSNGSGTLNVNGVIVDGSRNISNVNNLTVSGVFLNSYTPKAWCIFTDTSFGTGNIIQRRDGANITSITGSNGQYTLTLTTPLSNANYGVLVTVGTAITGGIPFVAYGFSVFSAQTTTTCQIAVVDASGAFVLQAPSGITVQILSST